MQEIRLLTFTAAPRSPESLRPSSYDGLAPNEREVIFSLCPAYDPVYGHCSAHSG
jgi:hypothetical protein